MWLFLPDAFLSVVAKDCPTDSLMVRSRRPGDIERVFPAATVTETPGYDYLYRAIVPRAEVAQAVADQVMSMDYPNFKNEVHDRRHPRCLLEGLALDGGPAAGAAVQSDAAIARPRAAVSRLTETRIGRNRLPWPACSTT